MGRHCSSSPSCSIACAAQCHDCSNEKKIHQALTLRVHMHCNDCEKKVAKALCTIEEGVESFMILKGGKVKVEGNFEFDKMMKALKRKSGRRAELLEAVKISSTTEIAPEISYIHPTCIQYCICDTNNCYTNDKIPHMDNYFSGSNHCCTL